MCIKNSIIPLLLFSLLGVSCKEEITELKAHLKNNTNHKIEILHFKNGIVIPGDTIILNPGYDFIYGESSHRGEVKVPMFSTKYSISEEDSIVVIFDDKYQVVHYVNPPSILSSRHYLYESTRNLGNRFSYEFSHKKRGTGRYINIHRYTFTEDDYNFAKE